MIQLRTIDDPSGRLTAIEGDAIPFPVRRVFYITDVPAGASRGGHAQRAYVRAVAGIADKPVRAGGCGAEESVANRLKIVVA